MVYLMMYCRCHLLSTHFIFSCQVPNELRSSWTYFYTKYLNLSSKCSKFRFKTFKKEMKFLNVNFDIFKGLLILTEFSKLGRQIRQIRQICQLSLSFKITQLLSQTQCLTQFIDMCILYLNLKQRKPVHDIFTFCGSFMLDIDWFWRSYTSILL